MATDHIGGEERVEALAAGRWGRRRWPDPCPRGQIRVPEADSAVVVGGHRRGPTAIFAVDISIFVGSDSSACKNTFSE
uniref:Uncharacterized protein n=1 Tax=Oryza barthii TaxID=65489 RepID=A0A0D3F576_9ORYZ